MRALILRRVGLIEGHAGGPIIVGPAANSDVIRLEGFLERNAHPHSTLDPDRDPEAKTLIERFSVEPYQLPIVLCPAGELLHPLSASLRCIGPSTDRRNESLMRRSSVPAPGRRGGVWRPKAFRACSTAAHSADKPARRHGSKTISASDRYYRHGADGTRL
jgi:hypothetical protein